MYSCKYPNLFSPITLAGTTFRSRLFGSPTGTSFLDSRHYPIAETYAYYEEKAKGGAASICVGDCVISEDSRMNNGHIALYDPMNYMHLNKLADAISRHGAVASIELSHSGSHSHASAREGAQLYGPMEYDLPGGFHVLPMTDEQIYKVIDQYVQAAITAKRAGFGMVTIHGGHGWLLTEFMSPKSNQRTDKWGGSPENRCRFAVEVCDAIRKAVGPKFPIEMRISGSECNPAGYDIDEGVEIAKQLDGHLDLIHVSAGSHEVWDVFTVTHPDMFLPDGVNVRFAAEIKKHVKHSKVATVGALNKPEIMEEIIASGKADVVQVARGLIADPALPKKARAGREDDINTCVRCLACFSNLMTKGTFICALNPVIGNEVENKWVPNVVADAARGADGYALPDIDPIAVPHTYRKKVLVAGGGIAGMQAALTAYSRGHSVTLVEKSGKLGGALLCEDAVPFKKDLAKYLERQAKRIAASGIDLRLNTEATPALAAQLNPDVVIAATGARPLVPPIPGIENAVSAEDVYVKPELAGKSVVILGAGLVGSELGIYLSQLGREVTIIEMAEAVNDGGNILQGLAIRLESARQNISVNFKTKAVEIGKNYVKAQKEDDTAAEFKGDTIIYALGQVPQTESAEALRFAAPEFYQIGDCLAPKNIVEANHAGYYIARKL
ncbi:MAG: FAD-dependent oxidoreductase [Oscillospiraceae bacterium]|jgi:2,4-dienoyl-CoA reductase-like NADH-dependent reductase (Old Yellow Enzyme family)/NADPH-dependent 2,4-dienoyl-CoA reductase/sulfur reductase-like enzyme|nr:FAD-dependent oxidoreductase [Oscillospiraceae bacterium]